MSELTGTPPSDLILINYKRMLRHLGYFEEPPLIEPPNSPNPTFAIIKDPETQKVSLIIMGSVFSYMTERTIRFFRDSNISLQNIEVYDISTDEKVLELSPSKSNSPLLELQQELTEHGWANYDFKIISELVVSRPTKQSAITSIVNEAIEPEKPIVKGLSPFVTPYRPSAIMIKPKKFSQLKVTEPVDLDIAPQPSNKTEKKNDDPNTTTETDAISLIEIPLNDDEKAILREILKHPKRKVQSNHIKKKTGLDQEVIRNTLRDLVDKNILRVSSGWYILKKSIALPISSKSSQDTSSNAKRSIVRTEARTRKLMAKIEAEAAGGTEEEEEEDSYPERHITPGSTEEEPITAEFDDMNEFPMTEEVDFFGGKLPRDEDEESNLGTTTPDNLGLGHKSSRRGRPRTNTSSRTGPAISSSSSSSSSRYTAEDDEEEDDYETDDYDEEPNDYDEYNDDF